MPAPDNLRISSAKLALAVKRLRAEKENLDLIASDPIAIVGMGCRFPGGADSPEGFWTALRTGRDCVGEIPAGRWKDAPGLSPHLRRGAYLSEVTRFDAAFFGISPREAQHMDPQQRLLLEVAWEALWDAGIEPGSLAGSDAGVFAAIYNNDYARLQFRDPSTLTAHAGIGAAHSVAAGRISFLLNIKGPSLAIDSACSSSLVATHLACRSLRNRECSLAIVGAGSLKLLSDEVLVFAKWGMLASDGKCKTFAADADGFVPGEGAGAMVLKRLSDALQDGDRVRAVIRGTAVNHDGRTTVLTAPNGLAQEMVLRAALENAMLQPGDIGYIETHGTGTSLGDPIEIEAVRNVYGNPSADAAECVLGAVKTNLGHLEAAAGIAGLIKAVLSLEHEEIPPNLHFHRLNPEISLDGSRLRIATDNTPWVRSSVPRVAAVSSFGLGGTNGHVIVEEAPRMPERDASGGGRRIPLPAHAWQRQPFWLTEPVPPKVNHEDDFAASVFAEDTGHPLLGRAMESPFLNGTLFVSDLNTTATPYLAEHRLGGGAIVPFAAFLEIASAAIQNADPAGCGAICNFSMLEPCFVSSASCRMQVLVTESSVEIASEAKAAWTTHAKCSFLAAETETNRIDLANLRERCNQEISPESIYQRLERTDLEYGPAFRTIQSVWTGGGESLARLRVADALAGQSERYGIHPTLLDGCLQTVVAARAEQDRELFLPIAVDRFELRKAKAMEVWVHTKLIASSDESVSANILIVDHDGGIVARLDGFTAKRTSAEFLADTECERKLSGLDWIYDLTWRVSPRIASPMNSGKKAVSRTGERWLLIENRAESCAALADAFRRRGAVCEVARNGASCRAALIQSAWTGIVYDARGVEAPAEDADWPRPEKPSIDFVLAFVKSLAACKGNPPRLWVVGSSAMAVLPAEDVSLAQAPLLGILRTLSLEHPETLPVLLDVGPEVVASGVAETEAMLEEEIDSGTEPIVAFRHGTRYVARLARGAVRSETTSSCDKVQRLRIDASGRLEDLRLEPAARRDPEPHQVEIQVRASGLNFRDVLTALGMLPPRGLTLGAECSGKIVRVGSQVQGWKAGDSVLAFAPCSLQTFVSVPVEFVTRKPDAMTFAEAAGLPVAFLTAHYALHRLAGLQAGQSVLIHAAAGGLGLAAVQLAMRSGARIFVTAGSPKKREFLKSLGIEHVFDSRVLAFRDEVLQITGGSGVDVVLNSLAGDFIGASLDTVAGGGCFLEAGKCGIWTEEQVAALKKNIRYRPFDLGDVAMEDPKRIATMFRELMERFATGELRPLPTALYSWDDATEAFRTMAQARHIGKIVLGASSEEPNVAVRDLVSHGTVLIAGGRGALGLEVARWLAVQGAKNIVLASRSVVEAEEHPIVAELRRKGVDVAIERVDVAASDQVEMLLEKIRSTQPPLRAVFHAAGDARDSVLGNETWQSYRETTGAKIEGAWNLHRLTQRDPIQCMVFFSSAASILGSSGQGSYASGNAFLDALARHRAGRGLRTLSVNWGAWAGAGMAARLSAEQAARWTRQGAKPMEPKPALAALQAAIESGRTQVAILDVDWERFLAPVPPRRDAALFTELREHVKHEVQPNTSQQNADNILAKIRSAPIDQRRSVLSAHVKVCARRVLGLEVYAAIPDRIPLQEVGLDSLMALEMRNELAQSLGVALTAGLLFDYPAVDDLTQHLLGILPASISAEPVTGDGGSSLAALESLSEAEAERLLMQELDRTEKEKANV